MSDSTLSKLRKMTEEGDLNTILKPSLGGYTKKSVQDYLATVKSQQESMKTAYTAEINRIAGEKQAMQLEIDKLRGKLKSAVDVCNVKIAEETAKYKEEIASLESDMEEALARIKENEEYIENCRGAMESTDCLQREIEIRDEQIQALKDQAEALHSAEEQSSLSLEKLNESLDTLQIRIQCLQAENSHLSEKLLEQMDKNIEAARENARIRAAYSILQRRLEARGLLREEGHESV